MSKLYPIGIATAQIKQDEFFTEEFKDPANCLCVDCGAANPLSASVSFGTYICLDCSEEHEELGSNISFVKSMTLDIWKDPHFDRMKWGGNKNFLAFLVTYGLDKDVSIQEKYETVACDYYKKRIQFLIGKDDIELPQVPNAEEGRKKHRRGKSSSKEGASGEEVEASMSCKDLCLIILVVVVFVAVVLALNLGLIRWLDLDGRGKSRAQKTEL